MIDAQEIQSSPRRPWLKPIGRAFLAILLGIYGQMAVAFPIWYALGSPEHPGVAGEFGVKIATIMMECSVLILIALDKERLRKYLHLRSPGRALLMGTLAALPLVSANRIMRGWSIRLVHGEFAYYNQLTDSWWGAVPFLLLQLVYYFFEVFVLVYAYAKLAEGLRAWRPLPRWLVIIMGGFFLFVTWSLAHGFVITDLMGLCIGLYLPFVFGLLYELTDSLITPMIAWFLPPGWQLAVGVVPLYWPVKAFWVAAAGEGGAWLWAGVGLAYQTLLLVPLLRRFEARARG